MNYHQRTELSSTQVAAFLSDPIDWYHCYVLRDRPWKEATPAMELGTNIHTMIELGGPDKLPLFKKLSDRLPLMVERPPGCDFRKKEWKAWKAEQEANGKEIVDSIQEIVDSMQVYTETWNHLQASEWCREVIATSAKEVEHVWQDELLGPCRCKFDAMIADGTQFPSTLIVDWKTCQSTNERRFTRDIIDRFYDVRIALYARGYRSLWGETPRIFFVAISTQGGYGVQPYELPEAWLDDAEARLLMAVDQMQSFDFAKELNVEPVTLEQPRWNVLREFAE